jgi:hypothetical protein
LPIGVIKKHIFFKRGIAPLIIRITLTGPKRNNRNSAHSHLIVPGGLLVTS